MSDFINTIKPLFPATYELEKFVKLEFKSNAALFTMLVKIAVYLVIGVVAGVVLGIAGAILPFLGFFWGVIGTIVGLYDLAGIVLTVLDYLKVFEPKN